MTHEIPAGDSAGHFGGGEEEEGAGWSVAQTIETPQCPAVQTQKVKLLEAKVTGVETVSVPAGKFETWKVEITSLDGGADRATLWVAKESRATVKSTAVMSSAGGATMSAELLP